MPAAPGSLRVLSCAHPLSRFFTMDLARRATWDWIIAELADSQVAGLPDKSDASTFFRAITRRLATRLRGIA